MNVAKTVRLLFKVTRHTGATPDDEKWSKRQSVKEVTCEEMC